jgi:dipeptidyl aminopeptidase/acylaminoacyl peptidase
MKKKLFALISLILLSGFTFSENNSSQNKIKIDKWLVAGPVPIKMPVFAELKNVNGKKFKPADLLKFNTKKIEEPFEDSTFLINENKEIKWVLTYDSVYITPLDDSKFNKAWIATYIYVDRFISLKINTETHQCFELYVDNKKKLSKYSATANIKKADKKSCKLNLERGKHLIVIKSLFNNDKAGEWKLSASITFTDTIPESSISVETKPESFMDIHHLLDGKHLSKASISHSGNYFMIKYNEIFPPNGKSKSWFEIKEIKSGTLIYSSEYSNVSRVKWIPGKETISFVAEEAGKKKLILLDIKNLSKKILVEQNKEYSSYKWSPNGNFLIYSVTEKPKKDKDGVLHIVNMMDRWPWWRNRGQLYKCSSTDGSVERITYGYLDNNLHDISNNGNKLIFSQSIPNFAERPYTMQIMMELNLNEMSIDTLWKQNFAGNVKYSPDGTKLLVTGSAAMFNGTGVNIPENMIPNDYDTQAYIYEIKTKKVTAITKDFAPSILDAKWANDNIIIFRVEEKSWDKLYSYNSSNDTFKNLNAQIDMVNGFSITSKGDKIVYYGSDMQYPKTAWICKSDGKNHIKISDSEKIFFSDVVFGKTENWNFKNKEGQIIEGRIYYPPDFEKDKQYPVIVYYYGGTSPTGRSFGGRYPKNLFAAQGYIVYVLQPSGATGFGQEFSALHVNNWGKTVADEIILGTKIFLKEHPNANPSKVGCIGASYGGFMTMLLTTRTNIFSAAIEHAGISSISSYWGEGYWGYLYSSVASANSFPWNNPDLYVKQSPLFNTDKVNTPLLLLHGNADTNVPVGESIQMFTALKLLGKPVELIEIEGQDHHITDYKKRIIWQKTIFAWFDKWLKNQPAWWDYLYPKENL